MVFKYYMEYRYITDMFNKYCLTFFVFHLFKNGLFWNGDGEGQYRIDWMYKLFFSSKNESKETESEANGLI